MQGGEDKDRSTKKRDATEQNQKKKKKKNTLYSLKAMKKQFRMKAIYAKK